MCQSSFPYYLQLTTHNQLSPSHRGKKLLWWGYFNFVLVMNILVTYASIGGNTLMVAQKIEEILKASGHDVDLVDMFDLELEKMSEYSVVFMGSSTWGDGEYNDFSQIFFDKLNKSSIDLSASKFVLFGLGENFYPIFCGVLDRMKSDLEAKKGSIVGEPIKIDGYPDDSVMENVSTWMSEILKLL